jgi:flagellar motor switch protein FliN/FliY
MAELTPAVLADVVAACKNGAAELAESIGRTFDVKLSAEVGEPTPLDLAAPEFAGPGLAVMLGVGPHQAVAVLAESCGWLPAWIAAPDATGSSKLATLAQELGFQLLPESLAVDADRALRVEQIAATLTAAQPMADAQVVPIGLSTEDGRRATFSLVISVTQAAAAFAAAAPPKDADGADAESSRAGVLRGDEAELAAEQATAAFTVAERSFDELPPYSRSLLRIKVPVMITLARKKERLAKIVELAPGSIIQFRKACELPLELEVNGQEVGEGEAVKVGEKFGLRVTGIKLPGERFLPVHPSSKR